MQSFISRLLKRYLLLLLVFFGAYVLIKVYYVYFYNGLSDQVSEGLLVETLLVLMTLVIITAKYLIFDAIVAAIRRKVSTAALEFTSFITFVIAIVIDIFALFASMQPTSDSGFNILIALIFSPMVLLVGLAVMLIDSVIYKVKSSKRPTKT